VTTKSDHRSPQAFKLEPEQTKTKAKSTKIEFAAEELEQELATIPVPPDARISKRPRWGFIFISALATLFSLWLGLSAVQIVDGFFAQSAFMGYMQHLLSFCAKFAGCSASAASNICNFKQATL
jgi:uncharacterized membrane protein YcjF (UPF0283 family)